MRLLATLATTGEAFFSASEREEVISRLADTEASTAMIEEGIEERTTSTARDPQLKYRRGSL
jgi:hypothetical protein